MHLHLYPPTLSWVQREDHCVQYSWGPTALASSRRISGRLTGRRRPKAPFLYSCFPPHHLSGGASIILEPVLLSPLLGSNPHMVEEHASYDLKNRVIPEASLSSSSSLHSASCL